MDKRIYLGIDTSNYTTSAAFIDEDKNIKSITKMLPVKNGELGLRQSDAVFAHIKQLPEVISDLFKNESVKINSCGVSTRPRDIEGSYMPCFLSGVAVASSISFASNITMYEFSHQCGHIAAALFGANRLDLIDKTFIAFHVSGGTTECLLVTPDNEKIIKAKIIGKTLDLNAGQAIDRLGAKLGISFPSGILIEKLAQQSNLSFSPSVSVKGFDCSLSGVENKCSEMLSKGFKNEDVALFCIEYIKLTIEKIVNAVLKEYGELPIVFCGGVMSNKIIKCYFEDKYDAYFARPEYSKDNAAGIAVLTKIKADKF